MSDHDASESAITIARNTHFPKPAMMTRSSWASTMSTAPPFTGQCVPRETRARGATEVLSVLSVRDLAIRTLAASAALATGRQRSGAHRVDGWVDVEPHGGAPAVDGPDGFRTNPAQLFEHL